VGCSSPLHCAYIRRDGQAELTLGGVKSPSKTSVQNEAKPSIDLELDEALSASKMHAGMDQNNLF